VSTADIKVERISADQLVERSVSREVITCTLSLDIALGGGIPLGCTVLVFGRPKTGKTSTVLQYAANAQNNFGSKVFYFNIEGRLSQLVMQQIRGLKKDMDNFEVVTAPSRTDKKGKVVGFNKCSSELWWEEIGRTITENPKSIVIVDSIANMNSEKEQSEGMGYQDRGGKNKLEAQFCRKYGDLIVPNQVTLFLITQIQANTSGYGSPFMAKVGNQIRHQSDIIMFGKRAETWDAQGGRVLGHDILYEIECSALGPPFVDAKVPLRYGYGIDNIKDIINHAIEWEIIKAGGSWYTLPFKPGEKEDQVVPCGLDEEGCVKLQGENGIRNWFIVRPEAAAKLEAMVREKIFI
jgi:recombination protein RecA